MESQTLPPAPSPGADCRYRRIAIERAAPASPQGERHFGKRCDMTQASAQRAAIVSAAREWIGTPYHHQASVKGVGADCLGLVRGVYREVMGCEADAAPAYSRDWAEASGRETLLDAAEKHLRPILLRNAAPGDVLIFRMRDGSPAKHTAILASETTMIHAMEGSLAAEVPFGAWWRRRLVSVFQFPEVS